jgi:hypothetical protein
MTENNDRLAAKAARLAAENTLIGLATEKPSTVAGALLANPDLFRELNDDTATPVLLALIDRGQADTLRQLLGLKAIGRHKAGLLAGLLLQDAFRE